MFGRAGRVRADSGIILTETRRDGRVAEGGGLLNRCTVKSCTGGSNPPLSAIARSRHLRCGNRSRDARTGLVANPETGLLPPLAIKMNHIPTAKLFIAAGFRAVRAQIFPRRHASANNGLRSCRCDAMRREAVYVLRVRFTAGVRVSRPVRSGLVGQQCPLVSGC